SEALLLSGQADQRRNAANSLNNFLKIASPASIWWKIAFERYSRLCSELNLTCFSEAELREPATQTNRQVLSVQLKEGKNVSVGDSLTDVEKQLGEGQLVPIVNGATLRRMSYPGFGVDLICTDQVVGISLRGRSAPELTVQEAGLGGQKKKLSMG